MKLNVSNLSFATELLIKLENSFPKGVAGVKDPEVPVNSSLLCTHQTRRKPSQLKHILTNQQIDMNRDIHVTWNVTHPRSHFAGLSLSVRSQLISFIKTQSGCRHGHLLTTLGIIHCDQNPHSCAF